jgi:glycosyltransferase involved in cell wall biosynthesis
LSKNIPYILDYDDAVFHNYDLSKNSIVRFFLKNKHKAIIEKSKLVIVGNQYLYKYAISASARRVEVVPTVVDLMRYSCSTSNRIRKDQSRKMPIVGWIGQKSTLTQLLSIKEILKDVVLNNKAVFNMIGGGSYNFDFQVNSIVWSEETEVSEINKFDIGIMPLYDSPFERGKCGYKLIQYMACGIPVVASPVGVNKEIVIHGVNGFLAETEEEWMASLNKLLTDPDLRKKMGKSAFESVSTKYSLQAYQSRFVKLLESVV